MNRRRAVLIVAAALAAPVAFAQQTSRKYRVAYLTPGSPPPDGSLPASLRKAFKDLGYEEGKNISYVGRYAQGKPEQLTVLAQELVTLEPDAIVTRGGPASEAAKNATKTIPIIVAGAGDVVATGLIPSLAHPGGNITGLSDDAGNLSAKRMQILKEAVPKARRIALLWNPNDHAMTLRYREIEKAARVLNVSVIAIGVREPDDFEAAFTAMTKEKPDALFLVADSLTILNRQRVIDFATKHRIPAMYEDTRFSQSGGLMSYGPSMEDDFQIQARLVDVIFRGTKPGNVPVEQPTKFYFAINLKTAKALGLTIHPSLLVRADTLIE